MSQTAMYSELVKVIQDVAPDYGVEFMNDYSGRCMYGKTCPALSGDMHQILNVLRKVTEEAHYLDSIEEDAVMFDEWMDMAFHYSIDQLGLGNVIYWPSFTVED